MVARIKFIKFSSSSVMEINFFATKDFRSERFVKLGLLCPKYQGSFGKQSCRSCTSLFVFWEIWLKAIPEFHWESLGSISLPFFSLSCCIKLLCKKGCGASVPGSSHTPAGRGEIRRGEEREGGAERAGEPPWKVPRAAPSSWNSAAESLSAHPAAAKPRVGGIPMGIIPRERGAVPKGAPGEL